MAGKVPKTRTDLAPISEINKITQPIGQKNVAEEQINPATEDTLRAAGVIAARVDQSYVDFCYVEPNIARILNDLYGYLTRETTLAKLIPLAKADLFNTALPAAEANWIGTDITPTNSPSYLRIYACVSVTGILRVARTVGAVTVTEDLNSGTDLVAGAAYMFTVPWRTGDSINIRYSVTTGTINRLLIDEIGGAE